MEVANPVGNDILDHPSNPNTYSETNTFLQEEILFDWSNRVGQGMGSEDDEDSEVLDEGDPGQAEQNAFYRDIFYNYLDIDVNLDRTTIDIRINNHANPVHSNVSPNGISTTNRIVRDSFQKTKDYKKGTDSVDPNEVHTPVSKDVYNVFAVRTHPTGFKENVRIDYTYPVLVS